MLKQTVIFCLLFYVTFAEPPIQQGVKPTNVIGGSDQHASFSFVRPGLTQTAFAFSGPSSHQSFSSSIGNPQLIHKVLPSLAHALAYRNPGLGVVPVGPVGHGYATAPVASGYAPAPAPAPVSPYQQIDPAALAYYQQLQQLQQLQQYQQYQQPQFQQAYSAQNAYQGQLAQLLALRQAQSQGLHAAQPQQVPEQIQLQHQEQEQQQQQSQNLLGVAYSSAPSVARVKVSGNGYKFDF